MTLRADVWEGIVRQHALKASLKKEDDAQISAAKQVPATPILTPQAALEKDLTQAQQKNMRHLASPGAGKKSVSKLKLFFLFLLFLLAGFLFFVAGFLTCYTMYPPAPAFMVSPTSDPQGQAQISNNASQATPLNPRDSYARRQLVARGQSSTSFTDQTQRQAAQIASNQARTAASQVVGRVTTGIQSTLGPYVGRFVSPIVTGVANSALNNAMPPGKSLFSSGAKPGAGGGQGGVAAQVASDGTQAPSAGAPQGPSLNRFTLVVQEFGLSQEALLASDALRSQGFDGYVVEEQRGKGDVVYIVKAGQFASYQEARESASLLGRLWQRPVRVAVSDQNSDE